MLLLCSIRMDNDVVHIDRTFAQVNVILEFVVYHGLESGRGVRQAKEHDSWFEKTIARFEGSLPFIAFFDADVIVSPSDVKFGEPLFSRHAVNEFRDQW